MLFGRSTENTRYYKQNIYFYNEITRDISGILQAINTFFFQFLIHRQFNEKFMYVSSLLIFICAKKKCAKKNCIPFYTVKIFKCRKRKFHMQFLCTFSLTVCQSPPKQWLSSTKTTKMFEYKSRC